MAGFAFLYERLLEQGAASLVNSLEPSPWREFLHTHRSLLERSPHPQEHFLSLAQSHGADSIISHEADAWLRAGGRPARPWLRMAQRPQHAPPPPPVTLEHDGGAVKAVATSPDGRRAASGGYDGHLRLWALPGGEALNVKGYSGCVSCLAWGEELVVVSGQPEGCLLQVLDPDGLGLLAQSSPASQVQDILVAGSQIYYAGWDGKIYRWRWKTGTVEALSGQHSGCVNALARCGAWLVSGCAEGTLGLWDKQGLVASIQAHDDRVDALAGTAAGLFSSGYDGLLKQWDLEQRICLRQWQGRPKSQSPLAASRDGKQLLAVNGGEVYLLDLESGQRQLVEGGLDSISSLALAPNGKLALLGSIAAVRVWDLTRPQQLPLYRAIPPDGERATFSSMAFTPDGSRVVTSTHGQLQVWDFASGDCLASLAGHRGEITSLLISPDGKVAVSAGGSEDYRVHSWDLDTYSPLQVYAGHRHRVFVSGIDNHQALSASWDGTTHLWDLRTGVLLHSQSSTHRELLDQGVLRECRLGGELYASSRPFVAIPGHSTEIWDACSGAKVGEIPGKVPFPPRPDLNGHLLAFAAEKRELAVFDLELGEFLCRWVLPHPITALALHSSDKVAVALRDGQCHFYEILRPV